MKKSLTYEVASQHFAYDPLTGEVRRKGRYVFKDAKYDLKNSRCKVIGFNYKVYYQHHIAWLLMTKEWPSLPIDHINRNPKDNRWCNLRLATVSENAKNRSKQKNNTSGHPNVIWCKRSKRWLVALRIQKRTKFIGYYNTVEDALLNRDRAYKELYGEFAPAH